MLRDLLIVTFMVATIVAFVIHLPGSSFLFLILFVATLATRAKYSHVLEKQLNFLSARLLQALIIVVTLGLLAAVSSVSLTSVAYWLVLIATASLPTMALFVIRGNLALSESKLNLEHLVKILRAFLESSSAEVCLIVLSLAGLHFWNIPAAILLPQLIACELALILPLRALNKDRSSPNSIQVSTHNLRSLLFGAKLIRKYFSFGLLASSLAYLNYLWFFNLHNLSPNFLDTSLPQYTEATTLTVFTLVLCLLATVFFERVDRHEKLNNELFFANKDLVRASGLTLVLLAAVIYLPGLKSLFHTAPLSLMDWASAMLIVGFYAGFRLLQRYTRKHTRQALIELHRSS
jgi:hypothetical protein